jgi:CRP/FNR family transcriptional regulator, anaerobic regulatory protein
MTATLGFSNAYLGSQPQSGESLSALDRSGKAMSLARGETLFYEGDAALYCFKVISGALRSCRVLADGRRHIAEFFLPGDFVALSAEDAYRFTAEAVTETKLMRYPRHSVEQMTEAQPRLNRCLLDLLCRSLSAAQQQMLLLGRKNAVERMASFLLMMADRVSDGESVSLPMTRSDIADHLGLTTETVSRIFGQLKSQRVIQLKGASEVLVKDIDALEELAQAA